ncbi:MAG TPA: M12 family metallo-peptidase [Steroidobacteraceae bacterium]
MLAVPLHAGSTNVSSEARILYFERFEPILDPRPQLVGKPTTTRVVKFDAFGRRFELALEPNDRLQLARKTSAEDGVHLYRGHLAGIDGSWARIGTHGGEIHGLIWDGTDLYVVAPSDHVRDALVPPLDPGSARNLLFRSSDALLEQGSLCATVSTQPATAQNAYASMQRELRTLRAKADADLRIEVSAIGDALFRAQFASDDAAVDQMLLRLNNVDGIYSSELGVHVQVPTTVVYDSTSDPFSATPVANDLLLELANLRGASPQLHARGLTHLFTGRDLEGSTVGIGYVGTVCNAQMGAALTEIRGRGAWLESLIAAHEIGHNFGAIHDGEAECSGVPQNRFLMSPTVHSTSTTFSNCSRNRIAQVMAGASCIVPLPPADLAIDADLGQVRAPAGQALEWQLPVRNIGGRTSQSARIEVLVPAELQVLDAWFPGGTCTSGAGIVDCELGNLAGGVTRSLHLTLRGSSLGTHTVSAHIVAPSDAETANNTGTGTIAIVPERDLGIALQPGPNSLVVGNGFSLDFEVSNATPEPAQLVTIEVSLPQNVALTSATVANGACDPGALICTIATLEANGRTTGTLQLLATGAGTGQVVLRVSGAYFDSNTPNDTAAQTIQIGGPATSAEAADGTKRSGGGGALGVPLALALLTLGGLRRARLR